MSVVRIYGGEHGNGEAVFRLEPSPDEVWRAIFEDGLERAVRDRVRLNGDRLVVQATKPSWFTKAGLNGYWTNLLNLDVRAQR